MTQHIYKTTLPDQTPVEVTTGWDFPLQMFFLNIEGPEDYLYTNLTDSETPCDDWSYFESILTKFGVQIPPDMTMKIMEDQEMQKRNAITDWTGGAPKVLL